MNLNELRAWISEKSNQYYSTGTSDATDQEFDEKLNLLRTISPNDKLLKTGHGYTLKGIDEKEKFQHPNEVGSIEKTKSISDIPPDATQSTKIDGNSIVAYYKNGNLFEVVTRGSENIGIIRTAKFISKVPKQIPLKEYISVRGEAAIKKNDYTPENGFDVSKSSRNAVAGAISRKEDWENIFKYVDFIAYTFKNEDTHEDLYDKLDWSSFFKVEPQRKIDPLLYTDIENYKHIYKDSYEYEADGMVFKKGSNYIAFKFEDETATTRLFDIVWSIGKDQRLTPVAILEPVGLAGATIERASLGSYSKAVETSCWPLGDNHFVEIIRANEIIPHIERTISKNDVRNDSLPICPVCGSVSCLDGEHVYCRNPSCGNIESSRLYNFSENFYPEGLSEKIVEKFFDSENIKTVFDLIRYEGNFNKEVYGIGESHISKINTFLTNIRKDIDVKILYKTFILNCGERASDKIVESGFDVYNFMEDSNEINKLNSLSNFSSAIISDIISKKNLFEEFLKIRSVKTFRNDVVKVGSFCITGVRFSKDELEKIKNLGWSEDSSVKKITTYLITKDPNSNSSKIQNAKKLNVPVVSVDEFKKIINI